MEAFKFNDMEVEQFPGPSSRYPKASSFKVTPCKREKLKANSSQSVLLSVNKFIRDTDASVDRLTHYRESFKGKEDTNVGSPKFYPNGRILCAPSIYEDIHTESLFFVFPLEIHAQVNLKKHEIKKQFQLACRHGWDQDKEDEQPSCDDRKSYMGIAINDKSRVRLKKGNDPYRGDFIDANYVNGFEAPKAFICAQTPMPTTVTDFLDMVWQENSRVIVHFSKQTPERSSIFECNYVPESTESPFTAFGYIVRLQSQEDLHGLKVSTITVQKHKEMEPRTIYHLRYDRVDQNGIPISPDEFVHVVAAARYYRAKAHESLTSCMDKYPKPPPIVVHCNFGTHQSGLFVALEIGAAAIDIVEEINLGEVAAAVQCYRHGALASFEEFMFLQACIMTYAYLKGH